MQVDNNKITLRQLRLIGFQGQEEKKQGRGSPFALYLSANAEFQHHNGQELHAKDTLSLPMRPIRRKACEECLSYNLKCQMCQRCHRAGKTCCRSIDCIYELSKYLNNRQGQIYKRCRCCKTFQVSTQQFAVDWRLLCLLHRVGEFKILRYSYFLHVKFDTLLISEEEVDRAENMRRINRLVFEQSYGIQQESELRGEIKEQNLMDLRRLLQRNVLKYVKKFEDWKEDDIQATCHDIIHKFQSNQHMQKFKTKMETASLMGEHDYTSGCSLSTAKRYINVSETTSKIDYNRFEGLSSAINRNILFFYDSDRGALIVKHAKYEQKQAEQNGIKIYGVMSDISYDLRRAVWFKDRKGDLFAFHHHYISIFKFHLGEKKFKLIVLRQDTFYQKIVRPESLVYVAQTDRVYFFDHNNFGRCYYFQLYRPYLHQKEFSDCLNVNPWIPIPARLSLFTELLFVKAVAVMQEVNINPKQPARNEQLKTKRLQLVPVIYLLSARRQPKQIFRLYRLVHFEQFYEIKQVKTTQQGEQSEGECNPNVGIFTVFKKEKQICICLQTEVQGIPRLIEGRAACKGKETLQVTWQIHDKGIAHDSSIQKSFRVLNNTNSGQIDRDGDRLLINDVAGVRSNNSSRYLAYNPSKNTMIEVLLSVKQGEYTWQLSY